MVSSIPPSLYKVGCTKICNCKDFCESCKRGTLPKWYYIILRACILCKPLLVCLNELSLSKQVLIFANVNYHQFNEHCKPNSKVFKVPPAYQAFHVELQLAGTISRNALNFKRIKVSVCWIKIKNFGLPWLLFPCWHDRVCTATLSLGATDRTFYALIWLLQCCNC